MIFFLAKNLRWLMILVMLGSIPNMIGFLAEGNLNAAAWPAISFVLGFIVFTKDTEALDCQSSLVRYSEKYVYKSGFSALYRDEPLNYQLLSIDGGKTWLALGEDDRVLGYVDQIWPGLIQHLADLDEWVAASLKRQASP